MKIIKAKNMSPPRQPIQAATSPAATVPKTSVTARDLIFSTFDALLSGRASWAKGMTAPKAIRVDLDLVIENKKKLSYRDALVVQFAFWLANGSPTDITTRQEGGRAVSGALGDYLASKHIRAVNDAFQNIGKNTENLARGNLQEFDAVLKWGADKKRTNQEIESAFRYTCAKIAANARPILPMPNLDRGSLTFGRVCEVLSQLYTTPSGGAFEQFAVAALLHALIEQQGETKYRVETKNLNASDKSSRSAGDIQILIGNRIVEALEVTANDWREKLSGAAKTIKDNDLSRLTIVAGGVQAIGDALFGELNAIGYDLSVLDVKSLTFSMVSALTRQGRSSAFQRLYELLDRYQPNVEIVNQFVTALEVSGLSENSTVSR